ncbi:Fatty acyl-CoA reductase 1 [Monoraphidium neglectum]|uniref:Fatty acyl-CoA reductase n=1 Tax=Monoraphidium neglectum TaxID=145388 RepID=A0A0D2JQK3_9CHLO|nr:Fatty acyl-CoA reductase 1 [Monoraphidium neglectum]KIZ01368.1 Fatty acyl-CoA reductase 1 [Monoraphidium neglectum]|eukprot:XP_013900387.1 Fatty acyl-CoA reductase 1 [Monoraphidium neglectum]
MRGSLVLESLLRTTRVRRVYVLLRGKRGCGAQERCDGLLQGPIFHMVRDKPELLSKVVALPGDLGRPRLGLSTSEVDALASEVDIIIHAAADIRLEAPIQETLRANYMGTRRVLELATQLPRLRSMVHVSTAYVNINHPHGATVRERIYPLMHGEVEADGERIAEELLALPPVLAERRSDFYRHHFGFPNTYCLGKHLAEQMVARAKAAAGLPVAVVRPSLVTGVAGLPWAGHIGNYAGLSGMGAATALGFFPAASAYAVNPHSVWDAVPGDLVASAILATAAAVAAGLAPAIAAAAAGGARAEAAAPWRLTEDGAAGAAKALHGAPRVARRVSDSGFSDDSAIIVAPPRGPPSANALDDGASTAHPSCPPSANDTGLLFDSAALQQLHARVEPSERLDYLLTFGPPRAEGVGPEAWAAAAGPGASGVGGDEIYEHPAARMGWRRYAMNCMAGIMHMMTGATPPRVAQVPDRPGEVIEHDYKHIR